MSTTVKAGWLKDNEGNKFAPKTISSQVYNDDGVLLTDQLDELVANVVYQSESNENISVEVSGGTNTGGSDGKDGFSPIATVTQTSTGATISITDVNGTTTATITNGKDGADGKDGSDATVTTENISTALGYTPANETEVNNKFTELENMIGGNIAEVASLLGGDA